MGEKQISLYSNGRFATLCGWSTATESGLNPNILKSMNVWLYSREKCSFVFPNINFRQRHYCGTGGPSQSLNPVIRLKTFCLFNFLNDNLSK